MLSDQLTRFIRYMLPGSTSFNGHWNSLYFLPSTISNGILRTKRHFGHKSLPLDSLISASSYLIVPCEEQKPFRFPSQFLVLSSPLDLQISQSQVPGFPLSLRYAAHLIATFRAALRLPPTQLLHESHRTIPV